MANREAGRAGPIFKVLIIGIVFGAILTAGAGFGMKISDERPFCSSCHIMYEAARTHKESPHAKISCNECHSPHNLLKKLPFKAASGTRDVFMNTFGSPEEPIHAGDTTRQVVNVNCQNCHTVTNMNVASMDAKPFCTDCHRNVQHMRMKPISTRKVSDV
jgi:cytochrome c nitrite reductase small subunit